MEVNSKVPFIKHQIIEVHRKIMSQQLILHVYFELFKHMKLSLWRFEVNKVIHDFKVAISKITFFKNWV